MTTQSKFVVMKHEAKRAGLHYDLRFKLPKSNSTNIQDNYFISEENMNFIKNKYKKDYDLLLT